MSKATFRGVHQALKETLLSTYEVCDIKTLKAKFDEFPGPLADKKAILDQAFRDVLFTDLIYDTKKIELLITLSISCCREDITTSMIPVILLSDVLDTVTLDQCEELFKYVEDNVTIWKEKWFFQSGKNNLLRVCNDLLKRFSRAQNTVFCGRILLFLATFFPFSERSGLNIISEFNLENLTEFETENNDTMDEVELENSQVKVDFNLYTKFWGLQDFFRNPNRCYDLKDWKIFTGILTNVLSAFSSFKLEEQRGAATLEPESSDGSLEEEASNSQHFFAKFLTNPKLLTLQLSDPNFRRSVLVQCLIQFQYLTSAVKFKNDSFNLAVSQTDFVKETEVEVYRLLEETPPNGKKFSETVRHMLKREELWNNWKNDGCKEFKRPEIPPEDQAKPLTRKLKRPLGDLVRENAKQGKFFMGHAELTRLWNLCPDNLQACSGDDRNFLPPVDAYLEKNDKTDPAFEWRALRLLARKSPHFFTLTSTPTKIGDYLESVRKKLSETKPKASKSSNAKPETENDIEKVDVLQEKDDVIPEVEPEANKENLDDKNVHKTITATPEQLKELSIVINGDWQKLGEKLGFTSDVIKFFSDTKHTVPERCQAMLQNWFDEDDDANLDNLAYIMDGLEMIAATDCVKKILEPTEKMDDSSD